MQSLMTLTAKAGGAIRNLQRSLEDKVAGTQHPAAGT
jgi:hypothetical protein